MNPLNRIVLDAARREGFVEVAFSRVRRLDERAEFLRSWLADGCAGEMNYMRRSPERRLDPRALDARHVSIVSLAYPYDAPRPLAGDWKSAMRGRIAAYAAGRDYHHTVRKKARIVGDALKRAAGRATVVRSHVDTGAILQREWAANARIGWFGRNTMILNRARGSYFFLAEILTGAELDATDAPYVEHCGTCRRCIEVCPTGALTDGYRLDARLCISYLTIELRGAIPVALRPKIGNWIFGCDLCQEICPWNDSAQPEIDESSNPLLPEILALDDAGFARRFKQSAVKRAGRRGLARNAAVALGNSKNPDAVPFLARALERDPEALVRAHAAWALGEIGGVSARNALDRALHRENDVAAHAEIRTALAGV